MSEILTSKPMKVSHNDKNKQILKQEEGEDLVMYGFKRNAFKTCVTYIFYVLTLGLLRLLYHWYPNWGLHSTHSKCDLEDAEKVLIVDKYQEKFKSYFVEEVKELSGTSIRSNKMETETLLKVYLEDGTLKESHKWKAVWCKKLCYVWDNDRKSFAKVAGLDKEKMCISYYQFNGYSELEQSLRLITYGKNEIEVPVNTVLQLLTLEALTPFYIFQLFSLIVWVSDEYYYYGAAIMIMSLIGITSSIIQTRRNQRSLMETLHAAETVTVLRESGKYEEIPSSLLVPGDVIQIPENGCTVHCDAVLLKGSCIVNESMLTGESVPITKTPLPKTNTIYDLKENSFNTLYCGTHVIQTRSRGDNEKILAVVLRTGFLTSKGELVRSILYPPPSDFKFDQDSYKYIGILFTVALVGVVYTILSKTERNIHFADIIIKSLDVITIVIPPALPAAMTVGKLYALNRLKRQKIFCVNSRVINVSGSIDCVCFDKTGTLTEDGLDMWGVIPVEANKLKEPRKEIQHLANNSVLLRGMATCHSISIINNELLGDPLDVKIFESTGWILEEGNLNNNNVRRVINYLPSNSSNKCTEGRFEIEIVQQYQFSSTLQRMSVVTRIPNMHQFEVFCKGSPEMVLSLSNSESIPYNIQEKLQEFTIKGYRVIALARKIIEEQSDSTFQSIERSSIECNLEFIGLVILENKIKPETPDTIETLRKAEIKTLMITGDNIQTAISVARECGMIHKAENLIDVVIKTTNSGKPTLMLLPDISSRINVGYEMCQYSCDELNMENGSNLGDKDYYAMTGTTWALLREHYPEYITKFVEKGMVFARMSGQQKQQLVQYLQNLGYYVAMCGDGANDCGALKAAHVGISLSDEESRVASAFTSTDANISCVTKIVKEGRAALTTSIGVFKFMVTYSLTQFSSIMILYGIDSNLTPFEFLFIDILLIIHFTSFFGKTKAYAGPVSKNRPLTSLLSLNAMASIIFNLVVGVTFQIVSYKIIQTYDWFVPFNFDPDRKSPYTCYENYAVFSMSLFQYIIMAIAFSKGKPFRKPLYTNKILTCSFIIMTIICCYMVLYPAQWIKSLLELQVPPEIYPGFVIIIMAAINFICSLFVENVLVQYCICKKLAPKISTLFKSGKNSSIGNQGLPIINILDKNQTEISFNNEKIKHKMLGTKNGIINPVYENSEMTKL